MITGSCVCGCCSRSRVEHVEPAHAGHLDVEQHEIERRLLDQRERFARRSPAMLTA